MSSKILLKFLGGCLLVVMAIAIFSSSPDVAKADSVSGVVNSPSSQLVIPYDERSFRHTHVQVTNTSLDTDVTVHLQLLDANGCEELNKFDTFTPNDTHVYSLDSLVSNSTFTDLGLSGEDRSGYGILVITPVADGLADPAAIAFNNLHGTVSIFQVGKSIENEYRFNAPGRLAVDAAGNPLEDGTRLDGVVAGLEEATPGQLLYHYNDGGFDVTADLILFAISDNYFGGADYIPGSGTSASYRSTVFDNEEVDLSCGSISVECIDIVGINSNLPTTRSQHAEASDAVVCDATSHGAGWDRHINSSAGGPIGGAGFGDSSTFAVLGLSSSNSAGAVHVFVK